jgi:hypothetical protein
LENLYHRYRDQAEFFVVYIREAHPSDGWRVAINDRQGIVIPDPKSFKERQQVASTCASELHLTIPMLIDGMDNAVGQAYAAWPDRLYIVDTEGRIAYKGGPGPRGFKPLEMEAALKQLLTASVEEAEVEEREDTHPGHALRLRP